MLKLAAEIEVGMGLSTDICPHAALSAVCCKAFDTVCHVKLFKCLVDAGVPGWIVLVIENWYSKLCVAVTKVDTISGF